MILKKAKCGLKKDKSFCLDTNQRDPGDKNRVGVTYHGLPLYMKNGDRVIVDDGKI